MKHPLILYIEVFVVAVWMSIVCVQKSKIIAVVLLSAWPRCKAIRHIWQICEPSKNIESWCPIIYICVYLYIECRFSVGINGP